jgi:3-oxoacyl-[acyl-carrier protein] reductase
VAFVTGGSRGIGRATALALGRLGCHVAVGYRASLEDAQLTCCEIGDAGGVSLGQQVDVRDTSSVDRAFVRIEEELGPVEILVNSAGVAQMSLLVRQSDEGWHEQLDTNLAGAMRTIRRAVRAMANRSFGRIVNIGSASAHVGAMAMAGYGASKAGLVGLSRAVARELAGRSVTCNVVVPGFIGQEAFDAYAKRWPHDIRALVPMGRPGRREEVASLVAYLASDEAGYITGSVIPVDGGMTMGL